MMSLWRLIMQRRHYAALLILTLVVRGVMFISYPMGGVDDDQSAQRFLIHELVNGNWQIGNLRYNTGYPFFIAPVAGFAQEFGRFDDRIVLFFQSLLSATIPFLIYDILRNRRSPREALFVALIVALDPFGLQWAHWAVPAWFVAWCLVLALWLTHRMIQAPAYRRWMWMSGTGLVLGVAALARTETAIIAAVLGCGILMLRSLSIRQRLMLFSILGCTSAGVLALYLVMIQQPSTGTLRLSCMTGIDLLLSARGKDIPLVAENGPYSTRALELLALESPKEVLFLSGDYPGWRRPGPWATEQEQDAFFNQPALSPVQSIETSLPSNLVYYLGLCPTDELLTEVILESIAAYPRQWAVGILETMIRILMHEPDPCCDNLYLPPYELVSLNEVQNPLFDALGFRVANGGKPNPHPFSPGGEFYTGQVVWAPGLWLFPRFLSIVLPLFWLTPIAILWAFASRDWWYRTAALLLLAGMLVTAVFNISQPRIYASFYPLFTIVIGGLLFQVTVWLGQVISWTRRKVLGNNLLPPP